MVVAGETPFIDPRYRKRSYIESRLIKAMEMMWAYKPEDRASIFEVVEFLQDTKRRYEAMKARGEIALEE